VKVLLPGARTGFIFLREERDPILVALSVWADAILPQKDILTVSLTDRAHRHGLLVIPWVLNAEDDVLAAQHAGVVGFASDDPCRMRVFLKTAAKR
jgi:glycerophosphoryl diester phosphodiesterase